MNGPISSANEIHERKMFQLKTAWRRLSGTCSNAHRHGGPHPYRNMLVERGSSALECQTLNRESPGSNPLCDCFEAYVFLFSP